MKVCHTLICFFFLTLQDGDTEKLYRGEEGTNITVACSISFSGSTRFFCKETCEGNNILIETTKDRAQRGRYSIQYEKKDIGSSDIMYVSITGLKSSDSGRYRCGFDRGWLPTRYDDFHLTVTKASTSSEPDWPLQTFTSTFLSSASLTTTATLTQRLSSSSSSSSPETSQQTRTSTGPKVSLQDGETVKSYTGKEGGSNTDRFKFRFSGNRKFFCKEICEGRDFLIETTEDGAQSSRYRIKYEDRYSMYYDYLHGSITELKRSNAARYRCRSDTWRGNLNDDFYLTVTEDTSEPKRILGPFLKPTALPAASTTPITPQSLSSSPSPSSSETSKLPEEPAAASALQNGDTEKLYRGEEGTNITVACLISFSGSTRFFCKETCKGKNILVETTKDRAQRGRYSIQYEKKDIWSSDIMYVSITGLKSSDSGRYRCGFDRGWLPTRYDDFHLTVTKASTSSEPDWTPSPSTSTFLSSASLTTTATLTQRLSSSSSSSSPETSQQTRTSTGPKDPAVGTEYAAVSWTNP